MEKNEKQLKVAFLVETFPRLSETWLVEQIIPLLKSGIDVQIFAFRRGLDSDISDDVIKNNLLERVTYVDIPNSFPLLILGMVYHLVLLILKPDILRRILKQIRMDGLREMIRPIYWCSTFSESLNTCDIVHCHFGKMGVRYLILKDLLGLTQPFVTTFYGQDSSKYIQQKGRDVYARLSRECSMTLTMTEEMTNRFRSMGFPKDRVRTHYTAVRIDQYKFNRRTYSTGETFMIAFVGRFVEKKGIPDLLSAVHAVVESGQKIELHIFGGGNDDALNRQIAELVERYSLGDKVVFYGMTSHSDVIEAFAKMHLLVQPSKRALNGDTDDLPFVLLEAQACGLPVISTYHVGIPDGVKDGVTGFLVPEGDYMAVAQKILYYINNPDTVSTMSVAAREFIETNFSIHTFNEKLVRIYEEIIAKRI